MKIGRKHGRYSKTEVLLQDAYWPFTVVARFAEERVKMLELVQHDRMPPEEELPENERVGLAGTILELIEALPIVVLPERRDCGPEAGKANGIREERIDASILLSELIDMYCVDQSRFKGFVCRLGELAGMSARITLHPRERQLKLSLGNESARSVENLGAGVLELMMLSLALEKHNGGLLLYEEPELHLHPTLQRSVMRMLKKECVDGSWQSLVTTHSNHILDLEMKEGVATHIVKRTSTASSITTLNKNEMRDAVELLGVRPSSLQEANALIWVEGPSDAIYLRFFIEVASRRRDIKLEEFMDFSFAFFGGALLAHMRLTDEPVDGFVSLLSIHPGSYLILDSDKKSDMPELGKLYARNFIENSDYRDRIWVTEGKEIEDYLPSRIVADVIPRTRNDMKKVKDSGRSRCARARRCPSRRRW
ncbi:ATP-dependent nuclease [Pyxidicoccus xibeiensis]|uniref:ATP-dependent nuclease n=1 Tax=Pyxidicoccus xibeiensis TaxID=2906759 RepID=UPI0020A7C8B8|nr:AAA family ATPase [Pyxidicoccus xibeiensis]MCP3140934.1 AAA family ATPase [Pyxidicoccus xibeiensis]